MRKGELSVKQVVAELRGEIRMYRESYREVDGSLTDKAALRTIQALKQAVEIILTAENIERKNT